MFVTNWNSTTKIQKISEITNFFRHYFLSRTEVSIGILLCKDKDSSVVEWSLRGITTPLGVASYQLQEVYERTLLEIKQEASEEES